MIGSQKVTVEEASALLKVNPVTVYRNIKNGKLNAEKNGKTYSILLGDLVDFTGSKKHTSFEPQEKKAKPFLKWAGGKRQQVNVLSEKLPSEIKGTYHEPFLGGGAFFFHLQPRQAKLSDSNEELVNTYKVVRDRVEDLIDTLSVHKNDEKYYYKIRSTDPASLDSVKRASRTIYLNRTCFNGLYRVNKKGVFNVPFGKKKGIFTFDAQNLRLASKVLSNAEVYLQDYRESLKGIRKNDVVYLDPPYYPLGGFADFQRYTKECFSENDHDELFDLFKKIADRGITIVQSNSNSNYIHNKYSEFHIDVIDAKRLISSNSATRNSKDVIIYKD
jgi:DNA adenine methylase